MHLHSKKKNCPVQCVAVKLQFNREMLVDCTVSQKKPLEKMQNQQVVTNLNNKIKLFFDIDFTTISHKANENTLQFSSII